MQNEEEQLSLFGQDIWSGRTYRELSHPTKEQTSRQYSKKRSASSSRKPPILKCLNVDGLHGGGTETWQDDGVWLGEYLTLNTGESPNVAVESHLWQILEETPPTKYYLSARACLGILNRAERRGKPLPEQLKQALIAQSGFGGGCDGGGKGALVQRDMSGTLGCNNDQTVFCLQGNGIDRADTAGCNGKGWREDKSYTLNTIDRPAVYPAVGVFKINPGASVGGVAWSETTGPTCTTGGQLGVVLKQSVRDGGQREKG